MYYVYFLKSEKSGSLYIGSCQDIEKRLLRHNKGFVKSTKAYRPWKFLGYKSYESRGEAVRQEKFYKTGQQRELLKKLYMA